MIVSETTRGLNSELRELVAKGFTVMVAEPKPAGTVGTRWKIVGVLLDLPLAIELANQHASLEQSAQVWDRWGAPEMVCVHLGKNEQGVVV